MLRIRKRHIIGLILTVLGFTLGYFYSDIISSDAPREVKVRLYRSSYTDDTSPVIQEGYPSYVMFIENGPVRIRMYYVSKGTTQKTAELVLRPHQNKFAVISPMIRAGQAHIVLEGPKQVVTANSSTGTWDSIKTTFPVPARIVPSQASVGPSLDTETQILAYEIHKTPNVSVSALASTSKSSMIDASNQQDVSFVYITAQEE